MLMWVLGSRGMAGKQVMDSGVRAGRSCHPPGWARTLLPWGPWVSPCHSLVWAPRALLGTLLPAERDRRCPAGLSLPREPALHSHSTGTARLTGAPAPPARRHTQHTGTAFYCSGEKLYCEQRFIHLVRGKSGFVIQLTVQNHSRVYTN